MTHHLDWDELTRGMVSHQICQKALAVPCLYGAPAGEPCRCEPPGWHLARIAAARRARKITWPEFAYIIDDGAIEQNTTIVLDPALAAAS